MMITSVGTKLHIYKCNQCLKMYTAQAGPVFMSCLVDHHGGCCHYKETEVSKETLLAIVEMVANNQPAQEIGNRHMHGILFDVASSNSGQTLLVGRD